MARLGTLLLLSLLLHQVTGSKHVLKSCSKRKPGKSTGGCSYTCNRRLGKWRAKKLCRTSIEVGKNLTEEEVTYEEPMVCGLPLAPGLWWPEEECPGEERWHEFLGSCVPANHTCADHVRPRASQWWLSLVTRSGPAGTPAPTPAAPARPPHSAM